jgi:hypothetical protein
MRNQRPDRNDSDVAVLVPNAFSIEYQRDRHNPGCERWAKTDEPESARIREL